MPDTGTCPSASHGSVLREVTMCPDCKARREMVRQKWLKKNFAQAAAQVAIGAAEAVGIKEKTGLDDLLKEVESTFDYDDARAGNNEQENHQ